MSELEQVRAELRELQRSFSQLDAKAAKTNADTLEFLFRIYYVTTLAGLIGFLFLFSRV
jgi:hypothetical protein